MLAINQTIDVITTMSSEEARYAFDQIKENIEKCRTTLLNIQRREGWRQLGYKSWREAVAVELGGGQSKAYRELAAAVIEDIVGEAMLRFGAITTSEGEVLKRLQDLGAHKIIEALEISEDLAYRHGRIKRAGCDVLQAVSEILTPNWTSQLFTLKVQGQLFKVNCAILYSHDNRTIKFTYRGAEDSISQDGAYEEELDKAEMRSLKNFDSPQAYSENRLLALYGVWQTKVAVKARMTQDYPRGSFVKIVRDIPELKDEIGTVALVVEPNYDGLCVTADKLGGAIILYPGCFKAVKVGTEGNPIVTLEDAKSIQDFESLIDALGAEVVALAFTESKQEVKEKIKYLYPGITAMVSAEVSPIHEKDFQQQAQFTGQDIQALQQKNEKLEEQILRQEAEVIDLRLELKVRSIPSDIQSRLSKLETELDQKEATIEKLSAELATKEEQFPNPDFDQLIENTIEEMGWQNTATVLAGRKALKALVAKLHP